MDSYEETVVREELQHLANGLERYWKAEKEESYMRALRDLPAKAVIGAIGQFARDPEVSKMPPPGAIRFRATGGRLPKQKDEAEEIKRDWGDASPERKAEWATRRWRFLWHCQHGFCCGPSEAEEGAQHDKLLKQIYGLWEDISRLPEDRQRAAWVRWFPRLELSMGPEAKDRTPMKKAIRPGGVMSGLDASLPAGDR
tara:strand:+ start:829 stop:1422 length:594 start_codon:yes stop_codon:yes gene_type:complete